MHRQFTTLADMLVMVGDGHMSKSLTKVFEDLLDDSVSASMSTLLVPLALRGTTTVVGASLFLHLGSTNFSLLLEGSNTSRDSQNDGRSFSAFFHMTSENKYPRADISNLLTRTVQRPPARFLPLVTSGKRQTPANIYM